MNNAWHGHPGAPIHHLVQAQAERSPGRTALRCGAREVTFGELNALANRVAHHLRRHGLRPDRLTALLFPRSIDAVVAALGVLKAGGPYVALDPAMLPAQINEIVGDARPGLVVTANGDTAGPRVSIDAEAVCVDLDPRDAAAGESTLESEPCVPDRVAWVSYVRHAMVQPAGVMVTHGNVARLAGNRPFAVDADGIGALYFPLGVGAASAQLFAALCGGVPVQILSDDDVKDVRRVAEVLDTGRVTSVTLPASVVRQFVKLETEVALRLGTLRTIYAVGGVLPPELIDAFAVMLPDTAVREIYGPVEAGGAVLLSDTTGDSPYHKRTFGPALPNTRAYILDSRSAIVPAGVDGDLFVGADHLSPGYWKDPGRTAHQFVADPISADGSCVFRTGDTGRYLADGRIELLGRAEDQVVVRGHHVDIAVVEAVLEGHEHVRDAAVCLQPVGGEPTLVGYVVANGANPTVSQLKGFLEARLPDYMVPSSFMLIDRLPRAATGEMKRLGLPLPEPVRPASATQYVAPRNSIEAGLAQIWSEVLMLDRVGIHDDFLALGGDSLIATQAVAGIWERFGLEIPFEAFFERATVAELAAAFFSEAADGAAASGDAVSAG
jgi:surfactin family lipopeptide synthetase A